jgi:protein-tyrosine-phosphatase/DNA-binding transcriptional ArsR family regulator
MESVAVDRLSTLGHPQRLAIFRLLMRRYPDEVAAGEIADALGIRPSTLSSYLTALRQANLVTQTRAGTSLKYSIRMAEVDRTFDYLLLDCCRGRPEVCFSLSRLQRKGSALMPDRKYNVLFLCTGNSARSIFAESILRTEAGERFNAYSAGTLPNSELNPFAVEMLQKKGHDISQLRSKHVSEFQGADAPRLDFVFTVCDRAANEECPAWQGQPISAHWGMPDPVKVEGTDAVKRLAFQHAYGALRNRIVAFGSLPFESLDRISLQAAVDKIGTEPAAPSA